MSASALSHAGLEFFASRSTATGRAIEHPELLRDLLAFLANAGISHPSDLTSWHLRNYFSDLQRAEVARPNRRLARAITLRFLRFLRATGQITELPAALIPPAPAKPKRVTRPEAKSEPTPKPEPTPEEPPPEAAVPTRVPARQLRAQLETRVVGQDFAKIQLSVLFSMHLGWFENERRLSKSPNAILIGPTGVGKTHTLRTASEHLGLPFVTVDTTSLVPSGIVGYQVEEILEDLVKKADEILKASGRKRVDDDDIELARRGVIFFDEFDKIAVQSGGRGLDGSYQIQRRLLKLVEGSTLSVGVHQRKMDDAPFRSIDTAGILVLAGGAFAGIDDNKIRTKRPEELKRELSKTSPNVIVSADIVTFGFLPELVARLPVLIDFDSLAESDLERILSIPEISPIQVWVDHFTAIGKTLIISDDARSYAAKAAVSLRMGARGLQQVFFPCLAEMAYDIEDSANTEFILTAAHLSKPRRQSRLARM
jgi:ATP-dependent Clp protease ATP-binding subunit ClpX